MKEITLEAKIENINEVTEFVNAELENIDCPMKIQAQVDIAIDELFSNIANYAYSPNTGNATVKFDIVDDNKAIEITFIDSGKPYNPLLREEPDVKATIEDRVIGGLGILMVKKSMDSFEYENKDGKNIIKIKKNIVR